MVRLFVIVLAVTLLVPSLAFADTATSGGGSTGSDGGSGSSGGGISIGGTVIVVEPDPGFCWGEGVIPGPPPEFWQPFDYGYGGYGLGGTGTLTSYGPGGGYETLSGGLRASVAPGAANQATVPTTTRRSQMYIPRAVWKWVAEHPVARASRGAYSADATLRSAPLRSTRVASATKAGPSIALATER